MSFDIDKLDRLPSLEDAIKLPKDEFNEIAKNFMNYSFYCGIEFIPDRMKDWCNYLKCEGKICTYNINGIEPKHRVVTMIPATASLPDYCFDLWHCPPPWFSEINYYCLGIFCFFICMIALILNVIYLPSFTFYGHRHGTDVLLTALVFTEILLIFFVIYLNCLPYIYRSHDSQVLIYSRIVAPVVPVFSPLMTLFDTLSSWILFSLLFERYLYQQHGKYSQTIISTKVAVIIIITSASILSSFAFLKFFELTSTRTKTHSYTVNVTKIGQAQTYHDIVTHLVKVPLEYFGPLLGYVIFLGMMYTSFGEQGISSFQSKDEKINRQMFKHLIIVNEAERETRILASVVLLSTMAVFSRFINFVYHVLSTEEDANVTYEALNYLKFSGQITSVIFILVKPLLYVYISPSYCRGMRRYFVASLPVTHKKGATIAMTFEQTIANQMRESISYRGSIWASSRKPPVSM